MQCERFGGSSLVLILVGHANHPFQFLAIQIHSASVNSMADERTASNFTWFNSSLRNRQKVETLTRMIQIRQWTLHVVSISQMPNTVSTTHLVILAKQDSQTIGETGGRVLRHRSGDPREGKVAS